MSAPGKKRANPPAAPDTAPKYYPEPVVVKPRKGHQPVQENTAEEWDPWTDGDPAYDIQTPATEPPQAHYSDLQRIAAEMEQSRETAPRRELPMAQLSVPKKKYAHIPLIADELKEDLARRSAANSDESGKSAPQSNKQGKKRGLFG
jgi:hypothetical protein